MPKKPFFESAKHHILLAAKKIANQQRLKDPRTFGLWRLWINSFTFNYVDTQTLIIAWEYPKKGSLKISINDALYYTRGDTQDAYKLQTHNHQLWSDDKILKKNNKYFESIVKKLANKARIPLKSGKNQSSNLEIAHIHDEEELSDNWAKSIDPYKIDVIHTNNAITSPELRFIHQQLGNIKGKKILDLGCGLGEVSVYFAIQGAKVTAVDLSMPMLEVVQKLAKRYKVKVETIQASVEELKAVKSNSFDYVYVGNVFHHVNIQNTLKHVLRVLNKNGVLVCWEPLGYNPIINVYRKIARQVRSHDERPFKKQDIAIFRQKFEVVKTHWFWLTTLLIFIIMATIEKRNPNKERYWKSVISESEKWKPIYRPLEKIDNFLLKSFPQLGLLCWNVVLICRKNRNNLV